MKKCPKCGGPMTRIIDEIYLYRTLVVDGSVKRYWRCFQCTYRRLKDVSRAAWK